MVLPFCFITLSLFIGDRGFDIEDLVVLKNAELVIPPFLDGRDALSPEEEEATRLIAKARVHVERFMQRMKTFKFVRGTVDQSKNCMLTEAVSVCAFFANFSTQLVK